MLIKFTKALFAGLGAVCGFFILGIAGSADLGKLSMSETITYLTISCAGLIAAFIGHRCVEQLGKRLSGYEIRRDR